MKNYIEINTARDVGPCPNLSDGGASLDCSVHLTASHTHTHTGFIDTFLRG